MKYLKTTPRIQNIKTSVTILTVNEIEKSILYIIPNRCKICEIKFDPLCHI